jgi:hypothetical protein
MEKTKITLYSYGQLIRTWIALGKVNQDNAGHSDYNELVFTDENGKKVTICGNNHTVVREEI